MRKLISLGIAMVILLFTFAGCAKEEKEDTTSKPQETSTQQTEKNRRQRRNTRRHRAQTGNT